MITEHSVSARARSSRKGNRGVRRSDRFWVDGFGGRHFERVRWASHYQQIKSIVDVVVERSQPHTLAMIGVGPRPSKTELTFAAVSTPSIRELILADRCPEVLQAAHRDAVGLANGWPPVRTAELDLTNGLANRFLAAFRAFKESRGAAHEIERTLSGGGIFPRQPFGERLGCDRSYLVCLTMCLAATLYSEMRGALDASPLNGGGRIAGQLREYYRRYNSAVAREVLLSCEADVRQTGSVLLITDHEWIFGDTSEGQFKPSLGTVVRETVGKNCIVEELSEWIWDEKEDHSHRVAALFIRGPS